MKCTVETDVKIRELLTCECHLRAPIVSTPEKKIPTYHTASRVARTQRDNSEVPVRTQNPDHPDHFTKLSWLVRKRTWSKLGGYYGNMDVYDTGV